MSIRLFEPHIGSKHRYTFYLATIDGLVTLSALTKNNKKKIHG